MMPVVVLTSAMREVANLRPRDVRSRGLLSRFTAPSPPSFRLPPPKLCLSVRPKLRWRLRSRNSMDR